MNDSKKKQQEDTDYTDEQGGGGVEQEKPLTREGFLGLLKKISRPLDEPSDEETSETSE